MEGTHPRPWTIINRDEFFADRLGEATAAKEGVEKELREVRTKAKMVVDRLTKEVGGLRSEKEGVERKLEEVKGYVQGRDEDKTVLEGLRGRVSKAEVAVADLTAENEGLKNQFKANNDELSVHKAKRLNAKSEVQKVVKQLTKIKKEHEEVVEVRSEGQEKRVNSKRAGF